MSRRRLGIVNFYCYCFGNINLKSIRGKGKGGEFKGNRTTSFHKSKAQVTKFYFDLWPGIRKAHRIAPRSLFSSHSRQEIKSHRQLAR